MVKTLSYLLILPLLILRSEAYAWSCWANIENNTIVPGTLYCDGIELDVFLETWLCVPTNYWANDPYCTGYQEPSCSDTTEQRSTACTEPNTVGFINESRVYTCASNTWSDWTISSNNCTPAPQTCFENTEERTVACADGYSGSILELRSTTCSTPYSEPMTGPWVESSNTCILEATDITNPTSVLNPASPVNPLNNMVDPVGVTPSTEPPSVSPVEETIVTPQEKEQPKEKEESKQEQKQEKEKQTEIVPGFGIAISLDVLNTGLSYQQQAIEEYIKLEQEQEYAREQDILLNIIQSDDYTIGFDSIANYRWRSLLHDNPIQSDAFGD